MANHRTESKDVYFGMFSYDIGIYAKYSQNISRKTTDVKGTGNVDAEGNSPIKRKAFHLMFRQLDDRRVLFRRTDLVLSICRTTWSGY